MKNLDNQQRQKYRPFIENKIRNEDADVNSKKVTSKGSKMCLQITKWFFICFNILMLLCGCIILGTGIWSFIHKWYLYIIFKDLTLKMTGTLLVVTGSVTLLTGILGYVGVFCKNKSLMTVYMVMMLLVFVFEAIQGLFAYVYQEQVKDNRNDLIEDNFISLYNVDAKVAEAVDLVHQQFDCCGISSYSNWHNSSWSLAQQKMPMSQRLKVPNSCCKTITPNCAIRDHPSNIYYSGCIHKLRINLLGDLYLMTMISFGVCLVQVAGVLVTSCLLAAWENHHEQNGNIAHKKKVVMVQGYWRTK